MSPDYSSCPPVSQIFINAIHLIGYVKTYNILPTNVYGHASGRLVELGIQNPFSVGIPCLLKVAMARGAAGAVGLGKNIWGTVHIDDREPPALHQSIIIS